MTTADVFEKKPGNIAEGTKLGNSGLISQWGSTTM